MREPRVEVEVEGGRGLDSARVIVDLWLPAPTPWRREPLLNRPQGRLYPHPDTLAGMARWRAAWLAGDRSHVEGAAAVTITVWVDRPGGHRLVDGSLSAEGRRVPYPTSRPDLDNLAKLALDALKRLALADDAVVVNLALQKRYTEKPQRAGARLQIAAVAHGPVVDSLPLQ